MISRRLARTFREKRLKLPSWRALLATAATLLLAACAAVPSPTTTTTWRDPGFSGPPFKRLFIVGLKAQSLSDQRPFEDLMVSTLKSYGVDAVPGWQYVPAGRPPDQATMRAAVAQSGADAALLVRLSDPTTQSTVDATPGVLAQAGPGMYVGWYDPGIVTVDYQAATIYTTLFDVRTERPVWTFNPSLDGSASLQRDGVRFANAVAGMLLSSGLVAIN
jgi:hypothetical protein